MVFDLYPFSPRRWPKHFLSSQPSSLKLTSVTKEKELEKLDSLSLVSVLSHVESSWYTISLPLLCLFFSTLPSGKTSLNYLVCCYQRWLSQWLCAYYFFALIINFPCNSWSSPFISTPRNMWNIRHTPLPRVITLKNFIPMGKNLAIGYKLYKRHRYSWEFLETLSSVQLTSKWLCKPS